MRRAALVLVAACGSNGEPTQPRTAPPDGRVIAAPAPAPAPPATPFEAAGVDRSSTIVQEAMALTRDAGAMAIPDAAPAPAPALGPSDLTVTVNGVTRRFTYGQATIDGTTLEVQLTDVPRSCDDTISQNQDAHLIFRVEGSPGDRFYVGHDIGVDVGAEIPDAFRIAEANPADVVLHLDRVPRRVGKRIEGTLDVDDPGGVGLSAHGRLSVPLCAAYPDGHVAATAPAKALAVGTAIAWVKRVDGAVWIDQIDLFDDAGLGCDAVPSLASRQLWEMGGTNQAHPILRQPQPATLSIFHAADHFTDTEFWSGWIRFDALAFDQGAVLRASVWAQSYDGKQHVGGTLRATVCPKDS